jgi:hypothetical protein
MEILILIAVIGVGASALFVAATFNVRIRKIIDPLVKEAAEDICEQIKETNKELERQALSIASARQQDNERVEQGNNRLTKQVQAIDEDFRRYRQAVSRHLDERIGTLYDQLSNQVRNDLGRVDRRLTQFTEPFSQQNAHIREIRNYVRRQGMQAQGFEARDSLFLAMLEAESHGESRGWGQPPRLYALTAAVAAEAVDREFTAEMRDARRDVLVPVAREPLPDGDLIAGLASVRWPEDVVGCVLVAELTDLASSSAAAGPGDPVAAGRWASTHPDSRPARLVVGVRRTGEYRCGLRIKGEADFQAGPEWTSELAGVLLDAF